LENLASQEFLRGRKAGKAVTFASELRAPQPGNDRSPVAVLLHRSGGVSGFVTDWEPDLDAMGVTTFIMHRFAANGIVNTIDHQSQPGQREMFVDADRATRPSGFSQSE
jgi:hypothetical protein